MTLKDGLAATTIGPEPIVEVTIRLRKRKPSQEKARKMYPLRPGDSIHIREIIITANRSNTGVVYVTGQ